MATAEDQREYQRRWLKKRRDDWIKAHGPCVDCGSWDDLEVDHKDPSKKSAHPGIIWSWRVERRERELAKCVVRCFKCHKNKTFGERRTLTDAEINEIRSRGLSIRAYAAKFGVCHRTIFNIQHGTMYGLVAPM